MHVHREDSGVAKILAPRLAVGPSLLQLIGEADF